MSCLRPSFRYRKRSEAKTLGVSARLVAATAFKAAVRSGTQASGGFDSHPLPFHFHHVDQFAPSDPPNESPPGVTILKIPPQHLEP